MITVILVPGTREYLSADDLLRSGMLANVYHKLDPDRFQGIVLNYPADYGIEMNYAMSVAAGEAELEFVLKQITGPVVILGYSQGAAVAGNVATRLRSIDADVRAVGLISDPARHPDQYAPLLIRPEGYGCTGARWIDDKQITRHGDYIHIWSLAAQGDPICCLPAGNPMRSIADLTDRMALGDFGGWLFDIIDDFRRRRLQRWWNWRHWRTWSGFIAFAKGMMLDGRHFVYPTEVPPGQTMTFTALLAREINLRVWEHGTHQNYRLPLV